MKCMICGGQTLPGAKLCLPCRAALRRARDDTISELLPLPRRRDGFAYQHVATVSGVFPVAPRARPAVDAAANPGKSPVRKGARRLTPTHFRTAAIALFTFAAAILAGTVLRQLQNEHAQRTEVAARPAPAETRTGESRVSPSALLGAARSESSTTPATEAETVEEVHPEAAALAPVVPPKEPVKAIRAKPAPARAVVVVDAPASSEPPVVIAAPVPVERPPVPTAADPAQMLAASIAACSGDFFARAGCEQRARAQYCDRRWGRDPQCPAGISNDHGQ